jgi:hypothetical protein
MSDKEDRVGKVHMRRCEVWDLGGWRDVRFEDLKKGDVFRMFEDEGTLVDGDERCTAVSDAYCQFGIWTIKVDGSKAERAQGKA